jgi:histidinol-phosphate phosphatase family protein
MPDKKQDFIKDIFPSMIRQGAEIYAYNTTEYLQDMGTTKRYASVEKDIKSGLFRNMNRKYLRPAVFFDRDGVLNYDVQPKGVISPDKLELFPGASEAVRAVNSAGWLSVVVTNQPHLAKGFMTTHDLESVHGKLETLLGFAGAKIDRIYYCPHHPEQGFDGEVAALKINCACRKPEAGMLMQAAAELPLLLEQSCIIGDSWRDIATARIAGIYAYGVRTGCGCKDYMGRYRPDLIFSDVAQAAKFAVQDFSPATSLVEQIRLILEKCNGPYLIGVCGLARSGKSSFSHDLARKFQKVGIKAMHVLLDDWIMMRTKRKPGCTAEERCQTHEYHAMLEKLLAGEEIKAPGYCAITREKAEPVVYKRTAESVIILDGLFACHESIEKKIDYKIFVDADEKLIVKRFYEFYRWKGDSEYEIKIMLEQRRKEEWASVKNQQKCTDLVITINEDIQT